MPSNDSAVNGTEKRVQRDNILPILEITGAEINKYIHPEKGLWLIQSTGAMPEMTKTNQVDKNFPVDFSSCRAEELPKVDCDAKSHWTKDGCFIREVNSFRDEKIWEFASLDENSKAAVSELAQLISFTAINTSLNARYYFAMIDGKWYLLFADLRTPCSA